MSNNSKDDEMFRIRRYRPSTGRGRETYYGGGVRGDYDYSRGFPRRRRFYSPYCDRYPNLPRGWWALPEYQSKLQELGYKSPGETERWDYYGAPKTPEAIEHEIFIIEKQIEELKEEMDYLRSLKKAYK